MSVPYGEWGFRNVTFWADAQDFPRRSWFARPRWDEKTEAGCNLSTDPSWTQTGSLRPEQREERWTRSVGPVGGIFKVDSVVLVAASLGNTERGRAQGRGPSQYF